jgi:CDI immunity proteins
MIERNPQCLTFALLDRMHGVPDPPPTAGEEYPLPAWYRAVRELPLNELGVEDICKACRQNIHPEQVVPLALGLLESEPLTGEMFDGELLLSLGSIPVDYWSSHESERLSLKSVIEAALGLDTIAVDVRRDAEELLRKTGSSH